MTEDETNLVYLATFVLQVDNIETDIQTIDKLLFLIADRVQKEKKLGELFELASNISALGGSPISERTLKKFGLQKEKSE